jgi:hypothetical protein
MVPQSQSAGSHGPNGWSAITLACTVSTREEVDTAFAAAVAAGATPVADATDRTARRTSRAPCGPRTQAKLSPARSSGHAGRTRLGLEVAGSRDRLGRFGRFIGAKQFG